MSDHADQLSERFLVLRCQAGDETAFADLVASYQPRLCYYLRKMLPTGHAVEDALQEVWLDVFRSVPRLADAGAFRAWLYRIARDRASRTFRGRPWHSPLGEEEPIDPAAEPNFTAEDAARIHAALDELPPEQREVAVLRFIEDMTYEEIARIAGCPLGTVRSRLHHARRALREYLERTNAHDREPTGQGSPRT